MTVGGVDTYYDYDEQQWKHRKLGGGPVRSARVHPAPEQPDEPNGDHAGTPPPAAERDNS